MKKETKRMLLVVLMILWGLFCIIGAGWFAIDTFKYHPENKDIAIVLLILANIIGIGGMMLGNHFVVRLEEDNEV